MIFIADEATPPDSIPPADIDDLGLMEAYPGDNHGEIVLKWYASGDDGTEGNAHHYQIRYSRNPIDESNWSLVQLVQNPRRRRRRERRRLCPELPAGRRNLLCRHPGIRRKV